MKNQEIQKVAPGGELRFEHGIQFSENNLTATVYFQISDDGQQARWVEGQPSTHPNGILLGSDTDRYMLACDAIKQIAEGKEISSWWPLVEIVEALNQKGIAFRFIPAADEEATIRQEIFSIQELRKTSSRNKEINQKGKELCSRLSALMEGRASESGIVEQFTSLGNGWYFKPKGHQGAYMGINGLDRSAAGDDTFSSKEEALAALEQYAKENMNDFFVDQEKTNAIPVPELSSKPGWYAPLRECVSLGSQAKRPGSLAGLHQARQEHLGQFFTPDDMARFIWRVLTPAMEKAIAGGGGRRISLFDNSAGSGRLFQFADPDNYQLAGVDVHGDTVATLSKTAEEAGFICEFLCAGMESIRPHGFNVGLINPPFSLHLEIPTLQPYPCTTWGKYGPNTSTVSHAYALHQAMHCCDVVAAILPRSYAETVLTDPNLGKCLAAMFHSPAKSFSEESTDVQTSILFFDAQHGATMADGQTVNRGTVDGITVDSGRTVHIQQLMSFDDTVPALGLRVGVAYSPKIRHCDIEDEAPTITLPVTNDKRVKIAHNGRRIVLKFFCGLTQARVMNALYRDRISPYRSDGTRLPAGIKYSGQGVLDIEVHLVQENPLASFNEFVADIARAGGMPEVDKGLRGYFMKRTRQVAKQLTPFRHVIYQPGAKARIDGKVCGTCRQTFFLNPGVWGSPMIKAGDQVAMESVSESEFSLSLGATAYRLASDEVYRRFELETSEKVDENPWLVKHPGRLLAFPDIAHALRKKAGALGIEQWLSWGYQLDDLMEFFVAPTGAVAGWDMGLGKARLAAALVLFSGCQHGLVVVEAHLIPEMETELASLPIPKDCWQTIKEPAQVQALKTINIISYNRLRSPLYGVGESRHTYARKLRRRVGVLVADEGHLLRNPQTQQSQSLALVSARRKFILTGTPVANYPRDIHPLLAFVSGDGTAAQPYGFRGPYLEKNHRMSMEYAVRGVEAFKDSFVTLEWCTNEFAETLREGAKREVPKIQNLTAYRAMLAHHVKRRLSNEPEVAKYITIPTPTEREIVLDWDDNHLAFYLKVCEDFYSWFMKHRRDTFGRGCNTNLIAILARINAVRMANNYPQFGLKGFGAYSPLTAKQRWAIDRLEELTADKHKTILYADNPGCLEMLGRELRARGVQSVILHGKRTIKSRTKDLDENFRFGDKPVMLASLGVTQTGLNIPQADRCIFLTRSWTHKTENQAKKRVLRPQQKNEVEIEFAHHAGSIDMYQAQMVAHKKDSADAGLDYATPLLGDIEFQHLDTILGRFCDDLGKMFGCTAHEMKKMLRAA